MGFLIESYCAAVCRKTFVFSLFFTFSIGVFGQWVKEDDTTRLWLKDGIYLTQSAFFKNQPDVKWVQFDATQWRLKDSLMRKRILPELSISEGHSNDLKIRERSFYAMTDTGMVAIDIKKIWGFCKYGTAYVQVENAVNENFVQVQLLGTISFLSYRAQVENGSPIVSGFVYEESKDLIDFVEQIVDFEAGEISPRSRKNLELILKRDKTLFELYQNEKRKGSKLPEYIRRYNGLHQITFE